MYCYFRLQIKQTISIYLNMHAGGDHINPIQHTFKIYD